MTQTHPITPPQELVEQWVDMFSSLSDHAVFSLAARWAADQELEACCEWFDIPNNRSGDRGDGWLMPGRLRAARRPKPPSLKERIAAAFTDGDYRTALSLLNEVLPND